MKQFLKWFINNFIFIGIWVAGTIFNLSGFLVLGKCLIYLYLIISFVVFIMPEEMLKEVKNQSITFNYPIIEYSLDAGFIMFLTVNDFGGYAFIYLLGSIFQYAGLNKK